MTITITSSFGADPSAMGTASPVYSSSSSGRNDSSTAHSAALDDEFPGVHNVKAYSYKELKMATDDFSRANKIGEGGFGCVYKGQLGKGKMAAIKVLSSESRQGKKEFLNEIQAIWDIEHENIVKLYGCCVEGDQRILVYEYLENNSLAHTFLGNNIPSPPNGFSILRVGLITDSGLKQKA
ncbi:cold-responsive protein kinase 1-like [Henckelia pumila]|uniref:cold-responsive protein kinase 1-like n=1 Tax=Henckelia pumila TaxID=405737 RepID=UPI003C6DDC90